MTPAKSTPATSAKSDAARAPAAQMQHFETPLRLDCGVHLAPWQLAWQSWGELNKDRSNAILLCHALSMDQYAAGISPLTERRGWWDHVIGPDKLLDTNRYFVLCSNIIGGCGGSTGPQSPAPNGRPYGLSFPGVTIADMVRAQAQLSEALDIPDWFCALGGSMGGMQVLQWAVDYPDKLFAAVPIAATARHSPQNIAFHEVGRQAILADPDFHGGQYADRNVKPRKGLAVARMGAQITYLSEHALARKFGRTLQKRKTLSYGFDADFQIESYLRHQGRSFVERFDANSYLYITRAMDYFDLTQGRPDGLSQRLRGSATRFCLVSFTSDWLYPTRESLYILRCLNAAGVNVSFVEVESDKGHDAFLLHEPQMFETLQGFLNAAAEARGL